MRTTAAILVETNKPLVIDEIEIPKLKPGQVLVKIDFSGVCHTQLLEAFGKRGNDPYLPHLLGHEGSATVIEIGDDVKKVKIDDSVILSWMKGDGANVMGTIYNWKGKSVNSGAITTFSKHAVVSENRCTVISKEFPKDKAALLGCALPTGMGVVFNTAKPQENQSIAIFGCGGIGLCAIQAAAIAKCNPIIAIDINFEKLTLAKEFGATHLINASEDNPIQKINEICTLDFAIEASGSPVAMKQALESVKNQGGSAVIVGNAQHGKTLNLDPKQFNMGKRLLGTWGGDNNPKIHFPKYCQLVELSNFKIAPFLKAKYSLENIQLALNNLRDGKCLRPLIDMSI
jgi:S-(hydroxymethyl)glutathione dehydrogenase / alcohol dehydrogenase